MPKSNGGQHPVALSLIVTLAIAAAAVAFLGHRSTPRHTGASTSAAARLAWLSQLATRFAVLDKPSTGLPPAIAKDLNRFGVPLDGLRYAHRAVFPAGTMWIIPEPSELCAAIVLTGSGSVSGQTCQSGNPEPGGLNMSLGGREHPDQPIGADNPLLATKAGIVDDNVTSVHFKRRDGRPANQTIKNNAFLVNTLPGAAVKRVRSPK